MRLLICEMEKSNHVIIDLYFEPLLLSLRSLKVHFSHIFSWGSLFYIMARKSFGNIIRFFRVMSFASIYFFFNEKIAF